MKCSIENEVLVIEAESNSETEVLTEWRQRWRGTPNKERAATWFEVRYYNPVQVAVI